MKTEERNQCVKKLVEYLSLEHDDHRSIDMIEEVEETAFMIDEKKPYPICNLKSVAIIENRSFSLAASLPSLIPVGDEETVKKIIIGCSYLNTNKLNRTYCYYDPRTYEIVLKFWISIESNRDVNGIDFETLFCDFEKEYAIFHHMMLLLIFNEMPLDKAIVCLEKEA